MSVRLTASGRFFLLVASPVLFLGFVASLARDAVAGDPCQAGLSPYVSTCINSDTLWPHAGPQVFATVGGTETVTSGHFGFGLDTDYLARPIVLHIPSPGAGGSDVYAIDNQVNGNFLWSYGVTRRLELDIALPITFGQNGAGAAPITGSTTSLRTTSVRDLRFGFAYRLVPHERERPWGMTARLEVSAPSGDRDDFAGDRTGVFVPSLAFDYKKGRFFAGLEIGGRIRPAAQLAGANVGSQAMASLGVGYDLLARRDLLGVMLEARTLPTFATQYTPAQTQAGVTESSNSSFLAPSEWMLAARSSPLATRDLDFVLGAGTAIPTGTALSAPEFRALLSIRFSPKEHPPKPKPVEPVGESNFPAAAPVPALDLSSGADRCKDDPDTVDGFKDDDGCPDEDADKDGVDDRYDRCPLASEDYAGLADGCPEAAPTPPKSNMKETLP
jgi:hypothetical protein